MLKHVTSILVIMALCAGCAGTMNGTSSNEKGKTTAKSAAEGGLLGAIVGAAVGYAVDGEEGAKKGALIGAGIGIIGGAAYGNHVANKRAEFESEEAYLNACIAQAEQINRNTRQYNTYLSTQIQSLRVEIARLERAKQQGQLKRTELADKQKEVQTHLAQSQKKLQRARDEIAIQREVYKREEEQSQAQLASLDKEIEELEQTVADLETETTALASLSDRIMTL